MPDATATIDSSPLAQAGDDSGDNIHDDQDPDQPIAAVIPFGVFDARAEAERFW